MITAGMMSAERTDWETPQAMFDELAAEFALDLDVCATAANAKCADYITPQMDGLRLRWSDRHCWMNPPYGREIPKWTRKARQEAEAGALVVALLPARTDARWFHEDVLGRAEVRFLPGRLYFRRPDGSTGRAPFPSMVVIWRPA